MQFVANKLNRQFLGNVLPTENEQIDGVLAAIAYGSDDHGDESRELLGNCTRNGWRLDLWMRYDHTVPVAPALLERLLKLHQRNVFCKLIPDYLHSKVIWWRGYGAYVGSANFTDRAWMSNIEAGLFLTEDELVANRMDMQLQHFFDQLVNLDVAIPLTQKIVDEMRELSELRRNVYELGKSKRSVPQWNGPASVDTVSAASRQKTEFLREWESTLTELRNIAAQIIDYRPGWVKETVPATWQADQFLHAYYYTRVKDPATQAIPYEKFHERNKGNPQQALKEAMEWWQSTEAPPSQEHQTFYESAPYLRDTLTKGKPRTISKEQLARVMGYTHATREHTIKIPASVFGLSGDSPISMEERTPLFADWLWNQRNSKGWDVRQLIDFVLYGGSTTKIPERLFEAGRNTELTIPRYGLNSLSELVGWVLPEVTPPRNGRTSKALRALGYSVRIH